MRLRPILVALLLCAARHLSAQDAGQLDSQSTLSVSARLVVVPTVVRDRHGALLNNLHRNDFAIRVDNQLQPLRYFDHDANVPLTLGLLVDTSMSQRTLLPEERAASVTFLNTMLSPADRAFVLSFDVSVRRLADVTASRHNLEQGLNQLQVPHPNYHGPSGNTLRDHAAWRAALDAVLATKLYDAIHFAAHNILSEQQGRHALILLTDGGDYRSEYILNEAIESAQRTDTVVYAIYYVAPPGANRDLTLAPYPGFDPNQPDTPRGDIVVLPSRGAPQAFPRLEGRKVLDLICTQTGGKVFEVSRKQSVAQIYAQIAEELRAQYRLGFSPAGPANANGYHRVTVTLTGAAGKGKPRLQSREGFYSGAPNPTE
jgi:VWFA-related protein